MAGGGRISAATGAASECDRPPCRSQNASVRANAPTASPHKSNRRCKSAPEERAPNITGNHDTDETDEPDEPGMMRRRSLVNDDVALLAG
jgi:hypothetical protein